ncbi:ArpU family phage packaging/lysis transcriptional regulator [Sutcliffiella horikoshii]|uniref:ArpU family phage packaging/lysis transcriptional regulator n=1 Tax=Sutcliffiella horikoshii TaxID=79883 RepID=UPI00292A41BF|nr:ArpU family phage packaging/lysis transcriptional regulator [Sutcliffiella horikoshii]
MSQLQLFKLPKINRKETQKNVEQALELYRYYLLTVPEERLPKVTASYSLVTPSNTNEFNSSTENAVIQKVDFEIARDNHLGRIRKAVNRLTKQERQAVIMKYFGDDELFDYEVYNELGMSETYYHQKFKPRIFYKLAFILRIEVFESVDK